MMREKGKLRRFEGFGNVAVGENRRAWQLTCIKCGVKSRPVEVHSKGPGFLWTKFSRAGWWLGRNASEDLCENCQHKRKVLETAAVELTPEALNNSPDGRYVPLPSDPVGRANFAIALLAHFVTEFACGQKKDVHNRVKCLLEYWERGSKDKELLRLFKAAMLTKGNVAEALEEFYLFFTPPPPPPAEPPPPQPTAQEKFTAKYADVVKTPRPPPPPPPEPLPPPPQQEAIPAWLRHARERMAKHT